jgi:hypothetical protein
LYSVTSCDYKESMYRLYINLYVKYNYHVTFVSSRVCFVCHNLNPVISSLTVPWLLQQVEHDGRHMWSRNCLLFLLSFFTHCNVCHSSIYVFRLPPSYLQTFFNQVMIPTVKHSKWLNQVLIPTVKHSKWLSQVMIPTVKH